MNKEDQLKAKFTKVTGIRPSDDWAAYFAFVSATLIIDIHNKIFEKPKSDHKSVFED